jgi:hypothetical protein
MSILSRRLRLKDIPVFLGFVLVVALIGCVIWTTIKCRQLDAEVAELKAANRVEVVEQEGVLDFPGAGTAPAGKVEFSRSYDSPPSVTLSAEGYRFVAGPESDEQREIQEKAHKGRLEQFERALVVTDVTPKDFHWELSPRRAGGVIQYDRGWKVRWKARGLVVVAPQKK